MRAALVAVMAVMVATSVARADEPAQDKSPELAMTLSISIPVAGFVGIAAGTEGSSLVKVGIAAMIVGPATGHWYAHEPGLIGLAARSVAAVALYYGLDELRYGGCDLDCPVNDTSGQRNERLGYALTISGLAVFAASTVYDVVLARREVGTWNREHAIAVAPTAIATPSGGTTMGIGIGGRF